VLLGAVHCAPPGPVRGDAGGADGEAPGRLLAHQHRLDRRQVRARPPLPAQVHARDRRRGALGRAREAGVRHVRRLRAADPDRVPRRARRAPRPAPGVEGHGRVRARGPQARGHVPEGIRDVRERRGREGPPGGPARLSSPPVCMYLCNRAFRFGTL
jgi:hypothetical protein